MTIRHSRWSSRRVIATASVLLLAVIVTSCFATQTMLTSGTPAIVVPGFWKGFWHGLIAPIAFVVSLFSDHVRIYASPNVGRWYDFGFMLGIGGFSGGIFAGSKPRSRARQKRIEAE
jgi:hypothetical protein